MTMNNLTTNCGPFVSARESGRDAVVELTPCSLSSYSSRRDGQRTWRTIRKRLPDTLIVRPTRPQKGKLTQKINNANPTGVL